MLPVCVCVLQNLSVCCIADGTVVPCYIAADKVQTPKEGLYTTRETGASVLTNNLQCFSRFKLKATD